MKNIKTLIILGFFVLLAGTIQPAYALWSVNAWTLGDNAAKGITTEVAHFNAAASKFEGLLNAYSVNRKEGYIVEAKLSAATGDLSSSLEKLNTALMEIHPTLTEGEQLAVEEAYSQIGIYLEQLFANANSILGKELLRIEYGEPLNRTSNSTTQGRFIAIIDDLNSDL